MSRHISAEELQTKKMSLWQNIKEEKRDFLEVMKQGELIQYNRSILSASDIIMDFVSSHKNTLFHDKGLCFQGSQFPLYVDYKRFGSNEWWSNVVSALSDPNINIKIDYDHGGARGIWIHVK